jgi:hypothetical protein
LRDFSEFPKTFQYILNYLTFQLNYSIKSQLAGIIYFQMKNNSEAYLTIEDIAELYNNNLREILAFVYGYIKNEEDVKDITQDIFFKLYNKKKEY